MRMLSRRGPEGPGRAVVVVREVEVGREGKRGNATKEALDAELVERVEALSVWVRVL